ncbi:TetR/AcrR family transcriptional regulator [Devosia sp.]|uniref:TetR/AcrR family transcriptional regulator n=1 Tax=Devosia sp. TaxID=1871048 RepID=UPI002FC84FD8
MSDTEHWPGFDRKKHGATPAGEAIDRRSLRTRMALQDALMRLTVARGYDDLSVAEIADAANVGRSTFYAHFTDKDDLLRSSLSALRDILAQEQAATRQDGPDGLFGFTRFLTRHMAEQQVLIRAMMRGRSGAILMDYIHHAIADILRAELAPGTRPSNSAFDTEFSVQFLVGGYLSVLTWWLERGAAEPPERIEKAFRAVALRGLDQAA